MAPQGYISHGGQRYNVPQGGGSSSSNYDNSNANFIKYTEDLRRRQQEEAERARRQRVAQQQDDLTNIMMNFYGGGGERERGGAGGSGGSDFGGAPLMSEFPGSKYKSAGPAPSYHEQMPLGGTPGVWAIRNDELGGPRRDAPWEGQRFYGQDYRGRHYRGRGRR